MYCHLSLQKNDRLFARSSNFLLIITCFNFKESNMKKTSFCLETLPFNFNNFQIRLKSCFENEELMYYMYYRKSVRYFVSNYLLKFTSCDLHSSERSSCIFIQFASFNNSEPQFRSKQLKEDRIWIGLYSYSPTITFYFACNKTFNTHSFDRNHMKHKIFHQQHFRRM